MEKLNRKLILLALSFSLPLAVKAKEVKGKIKVPNHGYVEFTADSVTGDYRLNIEDLKVGRVLLDTKEEIDCKAVRGFVKGMKGRASARHYNKSKFDLKFLLFSGQGKTWELDLLVKESLEEKGYSAKEVTNRTKILLDKIELNFEWDSHALSVIAKNDVTFETEKILKELVNSRESFDQLFLTGSVSKSLELSTLYCDIENEKLRISAKVVGSEYWFTTEPSKISSWTVLGLSKELWKQRDIIESDEKIGPVYGLSEKDESFVRASALAGAYLSEENQLFDVLKSGNYTSLLNSVFDYQLGKVKSLSQRDARDVSRSFERTSTHSKDLVLIINRFEGGEK